MQDFKRHIKEAISLNTQRLPLYAALTNNESVPFSKKLINYEKLILSTSWLVDFIGDKYQKVGVPFIIEEFIDMNEVKDFSESFPPNIDFTLVLQPYNFDSHLREIKNAISLKSSNDLVETTNSILTNLNSQPHVYCMTRHLIESIRRIAFLIPFHELKSKEIGVKPPTFYSWMLIKSHLRFLKQSCNFDEKVSFIQEKGVPFLWQDLPYIHTISTYQVDF